MMVNLAPLSMLKSKISVAIQKSTGMQLHTISEMPKFRKTEEELVTLFDKWLYAIKHLVTLMDRPAVLREAVFSRLFEQAEIARYTPEEQRGYRESQKEFWDMYSVMKTQLEKGRAEGRAEGCAEGMAKERVEREKERIANITRMRIKGYDDALIAELLSLAPDYVKGH